MSTPVLYSFRRCPYAMRARLAIWASGQRVVLREVVLRDKPEQMLEASPKGTVPVLVTAQGVIEESLDIMKWALAQSDPHHWLEMPPEGDALIAEADGPFKQALDRTKYTTRYPGEEMEQNRAKAAQFLTQLETRLGQGWLTGAQPRLADMAIAPFVRQFAFIDKTWFDAQGWPRLQDWLARFLASPLFASIMVRPAQWSPEQPALMFGQERSDASQ